MYCIKQSLPRNIFKELYHVLFESQMAFGISVWGGVSKNKLEPLFVTQKKCIRITFGDTEAFLDKFRTSFKTRAFGEQKLGAEFYSREPSKSLFLTIQNVYKHRILMELIKIGINVSCTHLFIQIT